MHFFQLGSLLWECFAVLDCSKCETTYKAKTGKHVYVYIHKYICWKALIDILKVLSDRWPHNMVLRVVLLIVGILTVQFCLFYNEHITNKGEDTINVKIFLIISSMSSLSMSVREFLPEMFWTQGHLFIKKTPWRRFFFSLLFFKTKNGECWVFNLKDLQR